MSGLLLTGATGHVGNALLPRLLGDPELTVYALVRADSPEHLRAREAELRTLAGSDRVVALAGDVTRPGLGLDTRDEERVEAEVGSILHSAAAVSFDLPYADALAQNVGGTEAVLGLARRLADRGRLTRLDHVSTAFVAGKRVGRVLETEIDLGQGYRNTYERTKCIAEVRIEAARAAGLPVAVHRPSIVVGDSRTGATRTFNVLYWPLKVYTRGWWRIFPGRPDVPVDVVPVDWLADAILALRARPDTVGGTFHLCAGDQAPTVAELEAITRAVTGGPPLRYVNPVLYRYLLRPLLWPFRLSRRGRRLSAGGRVYLSYFAQNPRFDTTRSDAALGQGGHAPPVREWFERVLRFAMEHWDRTEARE